MSGLFVISAVVSILVLWLAVKQSASRTHARHGESSDGGIVFVDSGIDSSVCSNNRPAGAFHAPMLSEAV